jgi:hypothetical protein
MVGIPGFTYTELRDMPLDELILVCDEATKIGNEIKRITKK